MISSYGATGKAYMNWCASMANSLDIGVQWLMCQEDDAPEPMVDSLTVYALNFYSHNIYAQLFIICNIFFSIKHENFIKIFMC